MRGGAKPGAGRKKYVAEEDLRQLVAVRLPRDLREWMKAQKEGNTALIELALRELKAKRDAV